jgi:hypothetical protein
MILSLIGYDHSGVWTKTLESAEELAAWEKPSGITWISMEDLVSPGFTA